MLRALALALALMPAALAEALRADQGAGKLEFTAIQAGAKFSGSFQRFQVAFDLDLDRLHAGRLDVSVETASIDTQDGERDEILRSQDFFWVDEFPRAEFHAARIERAGAAFRANGTLTMRGVSRAVPVEFTLAPSGAATVMKGTARLQRLDFGLGQGDWSTTEWIGDDVEVRFELKLEPIG
jgi:polyisoprenoid-binding protein YceI